MAVFMVVESTRPTTVIQHCERLHQTKVYGAGMPTLNASYSGFVNGDTAANLDTGATLSTTATATSDTGAYTITASGAVDDDYTISYVGGTLTVTAAGLTITADNQTKVYGAALPTLTVSYSGFVNGDTVANLTTQPTLGSTATASSDTGTYAITASGAVDSNYTISYVNGTLTVTPATLTIAADNLARLEGQANPPLTYTIFGLVNGDTTSVVGGTPILSTTATIASFDGLYPITITVGTLNAANYVFTTVDGILTVTETPATTMVLTANPGSTSTYGQVLTFTATLIPFESAAIPPTGTVEFEVDGTPIGSPVTLVNNTATSDSVSSLYVGAYTIEAIYSGDSFYNLNSQSATQTVTPAALTITADNQTKLYGAAVPPLTASYSGFVNGDTAASLTTLPTLSTTATVTSDLAGNPYTTTASGAVDSNYTISYAAGTLTITPAALTIAADNQTMVYGAALPTLTATYSGFVAGDTVANLTTQPTLTTTATASSHVGSYTITANGAVDPDYTISYTNGTLTVTTAALTITADNQTNVYGAALPTLTASYTGFVNGDTADSLTSPPTLNTTATAASHVADNPYAITAIGAVDSDYTISYVDGALTVTPAPLTITADNQTKVYGAALPTLTASYGGFVNGDSSDSLTSPPTLTTSATAGSPVAGNPYTITAAGAVDSDYSISYVSGTLNVTPVALTITADNQTKLYGAGLPTLTASYSGFVNGDTAASLDAQPTFTTTATSTSDTGAYYHHRQRRRRCRLHHLVCGGYADRHGRGSDDHRRQPDQGLRCGLADPHRVLLGLRQWRHRRQPDHPAHAVHDGHCRQPRREQSLRHRGHRRSGLELQSQLRVGELDGHPRGLDDHCRQPDQGLRRGSANAHHVVRGLRQWRHVGQPHDPAHADHDGDRQQRCRGQPLHHHRLRSGRQRLRDHLCRRDPHHQSGRLDDHGRQPDQGLWRGGTDADRVVLGVRQ